MDAPGILVAIIEDDEAHGKAVARLLQAEGFATALFTSAEAYLQRSVEQQPRCSIADVNLPGISGIDLMDLLSVAGKASPIILTSALRNRTSRNHAGNLGAFMFLPKPIDPASFRRPES